MSEKLNEQFVEDIVKTTLSDFETRRALRRPLELVWRLNMNFLMGNQYASITPKGEIEDFEKQYYWQEREVYNHIAPIVETRLAKLSRVRAGVSVRPKTSDERDISSAKFSSAILSSIANENNLTKLIATANSWSETCGTVFYKVVWNSEKGKVLEFDGQKAYEGDVDITVCPPFEIYPENLQVEEIENQPSIIHARVFSAGDVKRIWNVDVAGSAVNVFSLDKSQVSGGLGYTNTVPKIVDQVKNDSVIVIEKYEKPTSELLCGRLTIIAGDTLVYYGDLPYLNGESNQRIYPIIKQNSLDNVGAFFGTSVIERTIPVQRAYNALKNRKHEFLNRISMGVLAVEDGSVDVDNLADEGLSPGKIVVYRQGSTPPVLLNHGNIPTDFHVEENRLLEEFVMISGVSEIMKYSQLPQNVTSGVAISLLIEQDDTRIAISADNIRYAVKQIGKHILRLYKQFAVERRLKSIAGENGELEMFYFNSGDISSDDLVFDTENELVETPSSRKSMVLELLRLGLLTDENGKFSARTKTKLLETLGFGNWESSRDLDELHLKKAMRENKLMQENNEISPESIDNHLIHIEEHTKYILSADYDKKTDVKERIIEHINRHRQYIEMALLPEKIGG